MGGLLRHHTGALATTVLLLAALACLLTGLLPGADAAALLRRVAPVLGFVAAIAVVAELARVAGLLEVLGHRLAVLSRGRTLVLWLLTSALAVVCTAFFSLDTTAVIMTPVAVMLAQRVGVSPVPFALATVWIANTASLLLPVSNLTNLLARETMGGSTGAFLSQSWAPAVVAILVPLGLLAAVHRRELTGSYRLGPAPTIADRGLLRIAAGVVLVLLPLLVVVRPVWIPTSVAALVLLGVVAVRRRSAIRPTLLPWRAIGIALALFMLVATAHAHGLDSSVLVAADAGHGPAGLLRTSAVAALSANGIDNLPAFLLLERPVGDDPVSLMAVLIGVNAGPLVTPWASLATLLWHQRVTELGVRISWGRFMALGLLAVVVTVPLATLTLAAGEPGML